MWQRRSPARGPRPPQPPRKPPRPRRDGRLGVIAGVRHSPCLARESISPTILEAMIPKQFAVLLAEDDDALRDVLGQVLSAQGWNVFPAASGPEALCVVQKEKIDFSILDLHMPGLSGIETLQLIRQEVKLLPCIFISGQATKEEQ